VLLYSGKSSSLFILVAPFYFLMDPDANANRAW